MADRPNTARLEFAMRHARESGDLVAWIGAASKVYARRRDTAAPAEERALRGELLVAGEQLRQTFRSRAGRLWAAQLLQPVLQLLLDDILVDPVPDPAELFEVLEAGKARALLDQMDGRFHGLSDDPRADELERSVLRFQPEIDHGRAAREMRLVSALPLGEALEDEQEARRLLDAIEASYAGSDAGYQGAADPAELGGVRDRLRPDEIMVIYLVSQSVMSHSDSVAILLITTDGVELVPARTVTNEAPQFGRIAVDGRAPIDGTALAVALVECRLALRDGGARAAEQLRTLSALLVEPVLASRLSSGRRHWVVVPHRVLHQVPWTALVDPSGTPIIEHRTVTVTPSASVWHRLADPRPRSTRAVSLANPLLTYAGLPPLPGAEAEGRALHELWTGRPAPSTLLVGVDATPTALIEHAPDAGLLHLATHGSFPEHDALDAHRLLLTRTAGNPGPVTAEQMRRLDLRRTWCTVLGVCDGGAYRVGPGDEPYGLVAALLAAGSRCVVAAQWSVADEAARRLIGHAMRELPVEGPATAFAGAARRTRAGHAEIVDWAAFVPIGVGSDR